LCPSFCVACISPRFGEIGVLISLDIGEGVDSFPNN